MFVLFVALNLLIWKTVNAMANSLEDIFEEITINAYESLTLFSEIPGYVFSYNSVNEDEITFFLSNLYSDTSDFLQHVKLTRGLNSVDYKLFCEDVGTLRNRLSDFFKGDVTVYSLIRDLDEWAFSDPYLIDYLDSRERYFDKIRINTYIKNYNLRKQKQIRFEVYNRFNDSK